MPVEIIIPAGTFDLVTPDMVRDCLRRSAAWYLRTQREHIRAGVNADGFPFEPYSPGYYNQKSRAGREADQPDLRLTGQMLRSEAIVATGDLEISVEFQGMHARAWFKKRNPDDETDDSLVVALGGGAGQSNAMIAAGVDERRPFVGLSGPDLATLEERFAECLWIKLNGEGMREVYAETDGGEDDG